MNAAERDRIAGLARKRGEQLLETGLLERKAGALAALGWPEAVRRARGLQRAS